MEHVYDERWLPSIGVTNLQKKGNVITITVERPGLLIGLQGSKLTALEQMLEISFQMPIKIRVEESRVWD